MVGALLSPPAQGRLGTQHGCMSRSGLKGWVAVLLGFSLVSVYSGNNEGMVCYEHTDLNDNHNYYLLLSQELMFSCLLLSYGKQSLLSVSVCVQRGN